METPRIAVIETTIGSEQEMYDDMYLPDGEYASFSDTLRARGMEPVYIPLGIDNYRDVQNTKYFADLIRSCHIVFFTGGDQAYYGLALANPDGSPSLVAPGDHRCAQKRRNAWGQQRWRSRHVRHCAHQRCKRFLSTFILESSGNR